MKISIIIPAYNEGKYIGRCLESIIWNKHHALHEIIVVDNGSTDDTVSVVKKFPEVIVVHEDKKGVTIARERGFSVSSGDIIAYVDADTEMPKGWFEKIYKEFSRDPRLVSLSGPYRFYDMKGFYRFIASIYWLFLAFPSYFFIGYMVVGGNFAARRKALEQVNGFDTSISFYGDDTNIARRLSKVGKIKFKFSFFMYTSGRRLKGQGFLKTGLLYASNFLSEVFIHRPITKRYRDIR